MVHIQSLVLAAALAAGCASLPDGDSSSARINGLHVEVAGSGPTVVLLHGGQTDGRMWDREFASWSKSYRIVRYDVRAFGKSETPSAVYSDVEDLLRVLDELDVGRAHLVGLSLGGRIAIDFTLTHADRVASVTAVGPGLSGFSFPQGQAERESRYLDTVRAAQDGDAAKVAELWLSGPYMAPAMQHAELAPRLRQLAAENTKAWLANPLLEKSLRRPAAGRLAEIHAPLLAIIGTRDVDVIQAIVDKLATEVQGARKVAIEGAGHMVNLETPAEFDAAVLPFLEEHMRLPHGG